MSEPESDDYHAFVRELKEKVHEDGEFPGLLLRHNPSEAGCRAAAAEDIEAVPEAAGSVPEDEVAVHVPEAAASIPEDEVAVPEAAAAVPEDEVALPEDEVAVPEAAAAVPEDEVALPEDEVAVPEAAVAISEDEVALLEEEVSVSEAAAAVPEKAAHPGAAVAVLEAEFADSEAAVAVPEEEGAEGGRNADSEEVQVPYNFIQQRQDEQEHNRMQITNGTSPQMQRRGGICSLMLCRPS